MTAGTWSTAALSAARGYLAATSLPNLGVAIFAGGYGTCYWYCLSCCMRRCFVRGMHELQECDRFCECVCVTPCAVGTVVSKVTDTLTLCDPGFYSVAGIARCLPCGLGRANPYVGQVRCACCAAGTFANVSGLSQCFTCSGTSSSCKQPCTSNPSCSCSAEINCDVHLCPAGCFFQNLTCSQAPAGSYTRCSTSNCSASSYSLAQCARGL